MKSQFKQSNANNRCHLTSYRWKYIIETRELPDGRYVIEAYEVKAGTFFGSNSRNDLGIARNAAKAIKAVKFWCDNIGLVDIVVTYLNSN